MIRVQESIEVPYSCLQMFQLVDAVESYPDFLPLCQTATVYARDAQSLKARMQVGKGGLHYSLTTLNHRFPVERIEIQLLEGPFSYLKGVWQFEPLPEMGTPAPDQNTQSTGSRVQLLLEFELSNPLLRRILMPVLDQGVQRVIQAFCQRAAVLYA